MQEFACKNIGLECNYRTTGMTKEQSAEFMKKVENSLRPV